MSSKSSGKRSATPHIVTRGNHYLIDGKRYARVTKVCGVLKKPGLERWKRKVGEEEANRIMVETGEWGTKVHDVLKWQDKGMDARVDAMIERYPDLIPFLLVWMNWTEKYVTEFLMIEEHLWSPSLGVAGKVDRIAIIKGDEFPSVVDIKTGGLYKEVGLQMAAYKLLYNGSLRKGQKKAKRAIAVALPRKEPGELMVKEYSGEKWEKSFINLVEIAREMRL